MLHGWFRLAHARIGPHRLRLELSLLNQYADLCSCGMLALGRPCRRDTFSIEPFVIQLVALSKKLIFAALDVCNIMKWLVQQIACSRTVISGVQLRRECVFVFAFHCSLQIVFCLSHNNFSVRIFFPLRLICSFFGEHKHETETMPQGSVLAMPVSKQTSALTLNLWYWALQYNASYTHNSTTLNSSARNSKSAKNKRDKRRKKNKH